VPRLEITGENSKIDRLEEREEMRRREEEGRRKGYPWTLTRMVELGYSASSTLRMVLRGMAVEGGWLSRIEASVSFS
jgi:hypothetical protein